MINSAMLGLGMGLRAMIARFVGAGEIEEVNHVARQAFVVVAVFSTVVAVIGIFLAEQILGLMGLEADVVAEGAAYMRILFVGVAAMSFRMMTEGAMQSAGDVVTPMRIAIIFRIFHVILAPALIFGWWIFPRLGVSGAALTNVMSQSLGLGLGLWFLYTGRSRVKLVLTNFRIDLGIIWRMVKIGIPASIMTMQGTFGQLVLMRFMVPFGTVAVAAHTLVQRIEMVLFMPAAGLGMAAGVLAGQNLGAGEPGRAEKTGWLAAGLVEASMIIASGAILLWAEQIVGIFSPEPELLVIASTFLRIATAGYVMLGVIASFMQCLSGAGDTVPPMIIGLVILWVVQLPLAFFLPRSTDLGVDGIRWAMVAGMVVGGIAYTIYFRMGRWKRKQV